MAKVAKFETIVLAAGKTATGIEVPGEIVDSFAAGKKPPVKVSIGGYAYRTTVASRRGRYLVPLSAENRELAGVTAGDSVEVGVELDTEVREMSVPDDLAGALEAEPTAKRFFESLTYSQQKGFIVPLEHAKQAETRARRLDKAVAMLRDGRKR